MTSKSTTKKTTTKKVVKTKTSTKTTMKERKEQQGEAAADDSGVAVLEKTDAAETTETTVASGFVISADVTTEEADVSSEQVESVVSLEASDSMSMEVSVSTSEAEPEATAIDTPELSFSFTTSTDEPELDLSAELELNAALQLTSADTTEVEEEQEENEAAGAAFQISVDVSVDESAEAVSQEVTLEGGSDVTATVQSVDVEDGITVEAETKAEEDKTKADEEDAAKAEQEAKAKAAEEARVKAEEEEAARLKAEEEARLKAEEEVRLKAEEEARLKAEEEARLKAEEEARLKAEVEARIKAEEEARLKAEEEARLKAEEEARLKAEEEARKPKETETDKAIKKTFIESCPAFKPIPDEFYSKLFYFSGMGTLIGSSLSAGIYVPEDTAKCGLGAEQVESCVPESFDKHVEMVKTARNHATDLTTELRKLQALLQGLPIFTGDGMAGGSSSQTWRTTRHTSLSSGTTTHRTRASSYGGFSAAQPPSTGQTRVVHETFSSASTVPAQQTPAAPTGGYGGRAVSSSGYPGEAAPTSGYLKGVASSSGYTGAVAPTSGYLKGVGSSSGYSGGVAPTSTSGYLKGVGTSTAYHTGAAPSSGYPAGATSTNGYAGEPIVGPQYPFQLPGQRGRVSSARAAMRDERDGDKMASSSQPTQRPAPPPVQPKPRLVVTDAAAPPAAWTPRRRPWEQPAPDTLDVPRRRRARSLITQPAAPVSPVNKNYGVFTAQAQSWQNKYGRANVVDQPAPKPFGGVNMSSTGLKTWQMSRVRGMEAKGFRLDSEQVYIDNTPARRASAAAAEASQIDSLSPYLVSAKSRVIDYGAKPMSPTSARAFQPRVQNGYGGSSLSPGLPYCDL